MILTIFFLIIGILFTGIVLFGIFGETIEEKVNAYLVASYQKKVAKELAKLKDAPYVLFINPDKKLFYSDPNTTCLINGLNDYYEIYPDKKGQSDLFIDKDPECCNIIFVGPNKKTKRKK
ncbi:MAG TPA: hypothetical protein VGC65_00275 [Bacteroidia bacterium]|jgi:hypothetical protein